MAATQTLPQPADGCKPSAQEIEVPRSGVVTLFGYGIKIHVDRGHLILEDGIGGDRRSARLPRAGHGLGRLVVIGNDGFVSLAALRWLADQDAAFVMLERDGAVLATTGPVRPSDSRLRRAQANALQSGAGLLIARELIDYKLIGQARVARDKLRNHAIAQTIEGFRARLRTAETIPAILNLEAQAGLAYWSAWHDLTITFPKSDLPRVPEHWRTFSTRRSPLSGSPRLAATPINSILNYLYSLLESEARLAAAALGLDPGIGFFHVDTDARDSLACDLMEPVRAQVDAYVLDWIAGGPIKREWFFEQRNGNCRLMGSFAVRLTETIPMWRREIAPYAEFVARTLWSTARKSPSESAPATRLTQRRKREAKGLPPLPPSETTPEREKLCTTCGAIILPESTFCRACAVPSFVERTVNVARAGRVAAQKPEAQARRTETQRRNAEEQRRWSPESLPAWLDEKTYLQKIQPLLTSKTNSAVAIALSCSLQYAINVRKGRRIPHPRHWEALAKLVGISAG